MPATSSPDNLQPAIDIDMQVKHSIFLACAGITGIALLGSTGEVVHMSSEERRSMVAAVRGALHCAGFNDYPLMAGMMTNGDLNEVLASLNHYASAGAQWGLVLAPGYFGPEVRQEGLVAWFTAVADRSPIPILVYNYPGVNNGLKILPGTYRKLAKHPKIVGCKMSHANVSRHVQVSLDPEIDHDKFRVYSGFANHLGPIVAFGAAGVIAGMAAVYPKTVVRLMNLMLKEEPTPEERVEIHRLQFAVSQGEEFVMRYGVLGIKEACFRVAGFGNVEGGRLPLRGQLPNGAWEMARSRFLMEIDEAEASLN
ncbi:hypothetical protein VTJ49DRAFT_1725 [Mycothermus thermophilus]|uniref:Dihydrodipicolinate synthetase n=1 Tax=Humicola insolens TaxID=85995 RepID=A0ABR3VCH4_HUMIN